MTELTCPVQLRPTANTECSVFACVRIRTEYLDMKLLRDNKIIGLSSQRLGIVS